MTFEFTNVILYALKLLPVRVHTLINTPSLPPHTSVKTFHLQYFKFFFFPSAKCVNPPLKIVPNEDAVFSCSDEVYKSYTPRCFEELL